MGFNTYLVKRVRNFLYPVARHLFGTHALSAAPQIAKNESLDSAIAYLRKKHKIFRPRPVRFLLKLYRYLLLIDENPPVLQQGNTFIIHFCCWGKSYGKKVKNYLLPSLLSDGNLPEVVKKYKAMLLIHCDQEVKKDLMNAPVMKEIKKYAEVEFIVLPQSLLNAYQANFRYPRFSFFKKIININSNVKYFLLGGLQTQALEIAMESKSYISFLMPDLVLSDRFLTNMFLSIADKKMVVASAFRAADQKVAGALDQFFQNEEKTQLAVPAQVLIDLQINNLHTTTQRMVVSESTPNFTPCAQMLFETTHGFILRSFHYQPVLLDCCRYNYTFRKDYYPIDCTVLTQIVGNNLPFDQQISTCDGSSEMVFMELNDEYSAQLVSNKPKKSTYNELVQMIAEMILKRPDAYDTPLNRYFCSIKNKFESPTRSKEGNFIADDAFFSDVKAYLLESRLQLL